jgi:hypothetical protein
MIENNRVKQRRRKGANSSRKNWIFLSQSLTGMWYLILSNSTHLMAITPGEWVRCAHS